MRRPRTIAGWLTAAGRAGLVRLTPRTSLAVEQLLRTRQSWQPEELASCLAALLAEDGEGWQRIYQHCRDTLEFRAPAAQLQVRRTFRRVPGWVWATLLVGVVATAATLGPRVLTTARQWLARSLTERLVAPPPPRIPNAPLPPLIIVPEQPPLRFIPPAPVVHVEQITPERLVPQDPIVSFIDPPEDARLSSGWLALWILVSAALAGLAARWWWFAVTDFQRIVEQSSSASEVLKDELMRQSDRIRSIYFIPPSLPLARDDIDAAATILARMSSGEPGRELDVPPTMRRTIDAGGRFSPVYARRPASETLLVLVDVETRDGHAYLDGVDQLLATWEAGGLRFDRYDFTGSPERLTAGKRHQILEQLVQRHEGAPVLMFSRLLEARGIDLDLSWMMRLRVWPRRAWIDLEPGVADGPDRQQILDAAADAGLARFPFTRQGLLACVRGLAQGELRPGSVQIDDPPDAADLGEALELWAACAACVPDPTWPQLEAVRRQIPALADLLPDPRLVGRLLEHLSNRGWLDPNAERGQGERLRLSERGVEALITRLRRHDAARPPADALERKTRLILIEQLLAADVTGDPNSAARQQLKLRFHQALLDERELESLLELSDGPMADELRRMLTVECHLQTNATSQRWHRATLARVASLTSDRPRATLLSLAPSTWSRGHARVFLAAATLSLVSWAAVWALGGTAPPRTQLTTPRTVREPEQRRVTLDFPLRPDLVTVPLMKVQPVSNTTTTAYTLAVCATEVTQGQWNEVMAATDLVVTRSEALILRTHTAPIQCRDDDCDDDKPVTGLSWSAVTQYLNRLTEQENNRLGTSPPLTKCYSETSVSPVRRALLVWKPDCTGYRVPTSQEWEFVARAGSTTDYSFGGDDICRHANLGNPSLCDDGSTGLARVASYAPNRWGLYDVHGNAAEWVWERHLDTLIDETDPSYWHTRGGSYIDLAPDLKFTANPEEVNLSPRTFGLRCVRSVY